MTRKAKTTKRCIKCGHPCAGSTSTKKHLPKIIKIGTFTFEIIGVPNFSAEHGTAGDFNPWSHTLSIDSNMIYEAQRRVFMHEIIHAIEEYFHTGLGDDDDSIDRMATALLMVLGENNLINF